MDHIGIIGAGAWGTALAVVAARAGCGVTLTARRAGLADAITTDRENRAYLPGVPLDPAIACTTDLSDIGGADVVLVAVPAQHVREAAGRTAPHRRPGTPAVVCAKGIEQGTSALMSEVVAEVLPDAPVAVLSGPSFAAEVARDRPTAVTVACADRGFRERLPDTLGTPRFRIYSSDDVVGVQIGGAVKNVLAIACGIVQGRRLGENARAALITRGLAEIARLAAAMDARPETAMGLSGLGDMVLSCTTLQSRNYTLGVALGEGVPVRAILSRRRVTAEGVFTAASVSALAERLQVDMPICAAVRDVLHRGAGIDAAIDGLLSRPFKEEAPLP